MVFKISLGIPHPGTNHLFGDVHGLQLGPLFLRFALGVLLAIFDSVS
jgi:hypothetical protein